MSRKEWDAWLKSWLRRHPLKLPVSQPDQNFTREVMARIRAEQAPAPVALRWFPRRRFALAFGGALAAVLTLVFWTQRPTDSMLQQIDRDAALLFESGELWSVGEAHESAEELSDELQWLDEMELAVS